MDKNAIKKYAVWARRELLARVSQRAALFGVTSAGYGEADPSSVNGFVLSGAERVQRGALVARIREKGYEQVMEEAAYTWFNRFIALRFMEVNGYLPSHVRVFTDDEGAFKPQILAEAINLELDGLDMETVYTLKNANKTEELYKYLLITQCNALSAILPGMFQQIDDYTVLLFPENLLREGSAAERLVAQIPEEDWTDQVQIIGWLYQYYNTEPKDQVFADVKKNIKITKEKIPAATQLFTPDWIVRYMVENSLGRLWVEGHPNEELKATWRYYLEEAQQEPEVQAQLAEIRKGYAELNPTELRVIDPCCGSGHILCYLFDVLMQIYEACGYTARDAVQNILLHNLYGLDIDERAAQLSYFAVMMKARQYDSRFFRRVAQPHVYAVAESNHAEGEAVAYFCKGDAALTKAMQTILDELHDAKEYGSILSCTAQDWDALYARFGEVYDDISLHRTETLALLPLVQTAEALSQKYDVVVTNPPYMGGANMSGKLSEFVKKNYPDSKADLFAVFMERCGQMTRKNGYQAMITQHAWMSQSSFEMLRIKMMCMNLVCMAHLGARAFEEISGEVVQTTSFIIQQNRTHNYKGIYCRLVEPTTQQGKENLFLEGIQRYIVCQDVFFKIAGAPVIYWASSQALYCFREFPPLGKNNKLFAGTSTGDNTKYQRCWYEVPFHTISLCAPDDMTKRWYPCNTGGEYRKYTSSGDYIIDWENDGFRIRHQVNSSGKKGSAVRNREYFFHEGITWNKLSSVNFAVRKLKKGYISDDTARMIVVEESDSFSMIGFLCSKVCSYFLRLLSPTLSFTNAELQKIPLCLPQNKEPVDAIVKENLELSRSDRASFETTWDFLAHPLV